MIIVSSQCPEQRGHHDWLCGEGGEAVAKAGLRRLEAAQGQRFAVTRSASAAAQLFFQEVLDGIEQLHTVLFQVDVVGALTEHDELFGGCLRGRDARVVI
jgi:hypothetical protein